MRQTFWEVVEGKWDRRPWSYLAEKIGRSAAWLDNARQHSPTMATMEEVAKGLGLPLAELVAEMEKGDGAPPSD